MKTRDSERLNHRLWYCRPSTGWRYTQRGDYEEQPIKLLCWVCRLLISEMHDTAAEYSEQQEQGVRVWGGGGRDAWDVGVFPGSLPSGQMLHWVGKTKGQGQECKRVSWDMRGGVKHCSITESMTLWHHHQQHHHYHHHHHCRPPSSWVSWPLSVMACWVHRAVLLLLWLPSRSNVEHLSVILFFIFWNAKSCCWLTPSLHCLHTHTQIHRTHTQTLGFQDLDCLLSSLSALVYSVWILLAGTTRSPSDFVTTTKSALSMMPLLIPWKDILALHGGWRAGAGGGN